jgi:hypothetical protein
VGGSAHCAGLCRLCAPCRLGKVARKGFWFWVDERHFGLGEGSNVGIVVARVLIDELHECPGDRAIARSQDDCWPVVAGDPPLIAPTSLLPSPPPAHA